jgi:hypothetical protein
MLSIRGVKLIQINTHIRKEQLCCNTELLTLEKSSYAHLKRVAMPQWGTYLQYRTFLNIRTFYGHLEFVIHFHVPKIQLIFRKIKKEKKRGRKLI